MQLLRYRLTHLYIFDLESSWEQIVRKSLKPIGKWLPWGTCGEEGVCALWVALQGRHYQDIFCSCRWEILHSSRNGCKESLQSVCVQNPLIIPSCSVYCYKASKQKSNIIQNVASDLIMLSTHRSCTTPHLKYHEISGKISPRLVLCCRRNTSLMRGQWLRRAQIACWLRFDWWWQSHWKAQVGRLACRCRMRLCKTENFLYWILLSWKYLQILTSSDVGLDFCNLEILQYKVFISSFLAN